MAANRIRSRSERIDSADGKSRSWKKSPLLVPPRIQTAGRGSVRIGSGMRAVITATGGHTNPANCPVSAFKRLKNFDLRHKSDHDYRVPGVNHPERRLSD